MAAIAIVREEAETGSEAIYRAIASGGAPQAVGKTAGAALDAILLQLGKEESGTLVMVQPMRPDRFFTEAQLSRLRELMQKTQLGILTGDEEAERDILIETELLASAQRAADLADASGR